MNSSSMTNRLVSPPKSADRICQKEWGCASSSGGNHGSSASTTLIISSPDQ